VACFSSYACIGLAPDMQAVRYAVSNVGSNVVTVWLTNTVSNVGSNVVTAWLTNTVSNVRNNVVTAWLTKVIYRLRYTAAVRVLSPASAQA